MCHPTDEPISTDDDPTTMSIRGERRSTPPLPSTLLDRVKSSCPVIELKTSRKLSFTFYKYDNCGLDEFDSPFFPPFFRFMIFSLSVRVFSIFFRKITVWSHRLNSISKTDTYTVRLVVFVRCVFVVSSIVAVFAKKKKKISFRFSPSVATPPFVANRILIFPHDFPAVGVAVYASAASYRQGFPTARLSPPKTLVFFTQILRPHQSFIGLPMSSYTSVSLRQSSRLSVDCKSPSIYIYIYL